MDKEQAEQLKRSEEKQKGKAAQAKPNWKRSEARLKNYTRG